MFSLVLQVHATSSKHFVYHALKFYNSSEPKGSELPQLSDALYKSLFHCNKLLVGAEDSI